MASILVPVLYVLIVFGGLSVFSHFYRKSIATKSIDPYFPSHPERDLYVTLLQRTDPPTPDQILKSALVRRAMTDVTRVLRIREDKPALQNLLQKGSIGDDLWNSLLAAEKELEAEIMEVVAEANSFVDGWGGIIFETASQMIQNEKMRAMMEQGGTLRAELETKYGKKTMPNKPIPAMPAQFTVNLGPPPPGAAPPPGAPGIAIQPAPASPAPSTPAPATPSTPARTNGMSLPASASKAESVAASSDGEASSPMTPSGSKSGKKKSKKRK